MAQASRSRHTPVNTVFKRRVLLKAWNRTSETTIRFSMWNLHHGAGSVTNCTKIYNQQAACEIRSTVLTPLTTKTAALWDAYKHFRGTSYFGLPDNSNGFLDTIPRYKTGLRHVPKDNLLRSRNGLDLARCSSISQLNCNNIPHVSPLTSER
jgi:hypothetical protein